MERINNTLYFNQQNIMYIKENYIQLQLISILGILTLMNKGFILDSGFRDCVIID